MLERVTIGKGQRRVGDPGMVELGQLHLDDPAPTPSQIVDAGADEDAAKPGVEVIGVAELGQVPPGARKRLLDGVLRPFGIVGDHSGDGIETSDRGGGQARRRRDRLPLP